MAKKEEKLLGEQFLYELFFMAFKSPHIASLISEHLKSSYLPDDDFQSLLKAIAVHYRAYKECPTYGVMLNKFSSNDDVIALIGTIRDTEVDCSAEALIDGLEQYIIDIRMAQVYEQIGQLYNKDKKDKATEILLAHAEFVQGFSLKGEDFTEIIETIEERHIENKVKNEISNTDTKKVITRFYIDDIDTLNNRNLRGQVACMLASTGVGKSHAAIHVGASAAMDGFHVLHFQLEGSKDEVNNAYSGTLARKNAFDFEKANLTSREIRKLKLKLAETDGTISVRAYPRFNNQVSTLDISNGIAEYRKKKGHNPDYVIIDSMDLLTDASGINNSGERERFKRVAVVNDLKDISGEEDCFILTTAQANINDREKINDPKFVLTEYNAAEAKGIARPLTWLITLNQTEDERNEGIMRLFIAKTRHTKRPKGAFRIATDYDAGMFYDRDRTLDIQKRDNK